jgi:epoxyqueuosine reductase
MSESSGLLKKKAAELGFSKVGVAAAGALAEEGRKLNAWLNRGYHASMSWMARDPAKRADPRRVLEGVRSVISVAVNYYTPEKHPRQTGTGKISRYAWGDDYHEIVTARLDELQQWLLENYPGSNARRYVDTGPVMEKSWAQRAGIGWLGKHANIITQDIGSWVFLGEILTTVEFEADLPATDHCGTCSLCIEACPTHAIVEPYVVDSGRCLSYLTIEHRGPITGGIVNDFDDWIYGCDVCQDVCPWNEKFAKPSNDDRFAPRSGNLAPVLEEWGGMDQAEFSKRFKGSPVKRTKLAGLKRNIDIVKVPADPRAGKPASHRKGHAP